MNIVSHKMASLEEKRAEFIHDEFMKIFNELPLERRARVLQVFNSDGLDAALTEMQEKSWNDILLIFIGTILVTLIFLLLSAGKN